MFDNIGGKMKSVAEVIVWLSIIGWVIIGSVMIAEARDSYDPSAIGTLGGLVVMIAGSFSSWVSSLVLYGLGQLIENTDIISSKYAANTADKTQSASNVAKKSANLDPCLGTCELCEKENVKVARCKIVDSMGRRYYYYLCADCMKEYNAVPIKK